MPGTRVAARPGSCARTLAGPVAGGSGHRQQRVAHRAAQPSLLLVLDGVTDPHNLGLPARGRWCGRARRDCAQGSCSRHQRHGGQGGKRRSQSVPYFMVTNLARTLGELKERSIWITGTSDARAPNAVPGGSARADRLWCSARRAGACASSRPRPAISWSVFPMRGAVESLNVSVASGVFTRPCGNGWHPSCYNKYSNIANVYGGLTTYLS